eukprot:8359406-Pyramimonas_sp.AAC.1
MKPLKKRGKPWDTHREGYVFGRTPIEDGRPPPSYIPGLGPKFLVHSTPGIGIDVPSIIRGWGLALAIAIWIYTNQNSYECGS